MKKNSKRKKKNLIINFENEKKIELNLKKIWAEEINKWIIYHKSENLKIKSRDN